MLHTIGIRIAPGCGARVERYVEILRRHLAERSATMLLDEGPAELTLALEVVPGAGEEGYRISDGPPGEVHICGHDERGLLYGLGRFLRTSFGPQGFSAGGWRGSSAPQGRLRGMYLASHFHNWYHVAPEEELARYLEDLALWGLNAISVAFPLVDLQGWDDPATPLAVAQVHKLLSIARKLGLRTGLMAVPNQGFQDTPAALRGARLPDPLGRRGNLGVNLCPSLPAAAELIESNYRRLLAQWQDVGLDLLCLWPYDEGGCACARCQPWGANGYLRSARAVAEIARSYYPNLQVILSTWMFDTPPEGEWEGLSAALAQGNDWVDYIMADAHEDYPRYPLERGAPGNLPLLNFPEISMWGLFPWGGYGANPLPGRLQGLWEQVRGAVSGGFPYSEGLFEDLNKVVVSQFYWDPARTAADTVQEYAAYAYGADAAPQVLEMVGLIERNHVAVAREGRLSLGAAARAWALAQEVDAGLAPWARASWRWRILYLRALLDWERYAALVGGPEGPWAASTGDDFVPLDAARLGQGWGALLQGNAAARAAFRELIALYRCQERGAVAPHTWVRPPLSEEG